MGDFQERGQGNHAEIEVVRPDTPPTPGGPGSEENTTIRVTLETAVAGLATPQTPGDTSLEPRAATPPTPGTPVVWDLFESLPGSPNNLFSPPTPGRGEGGTYVKAHFCLLFFTDISNLKRFEQIELQAKLLNYFLGSNKSNINQSPTQVQDTPPTPGRTVTQVDWVRTKILEPPIHLDAATNYFTPSIEPPGI